MTLPTTHLRGADLRELVAVLQDQRAARHDVIVIGSRLRTEVQYDLSVQLVVPDAATQLSIDGVGTTDLYLQLLPRAVETLAERTNIPLPYLRRCLEQEPDLAAENLNAWLRRLEKQVLVRAFYRPETGEGVARAVLGSTYKVIDSLDTTLAMLDAVRQVGLDISRIEVGQANLSERGGMSLRVIVPDVHVFAPDLLDHYRAPDGSFGRDLPVIQAGLHIANNETGGGARTIAPHLQVQVCKNGMTQWQDVLRAVHIGGKLDEGIIDWSEDTRRHELELVTAQAVDAIRTFCSQEYLEQAVDRMRVLAGQPVANTDKVVVVAKEFGFTEEVQQDILRHFLSGGDHTAFGVAQAFSSVAHTIADPALADDVEGRALAAAERVTTT